VEKLPVATVLAAAAPGFEAWSDRPSAMWSGTCAACRVHAGTASSAS